MNFANAIDFNLLMEPVAARLAGEPNKRLSKPPHDVRFGTHGSLSIDYEAGQFYDHEANVGGGVCDLVKHKMGVDHAGAIAWLRQQGFLPSLEPRLKVIRDTSAISYDYVDEGGILLSQVIRHEPKDFRQRRPDGREGWIWNLEGARRVLYRLPDLIAASGNLIFITEGEKDCDNVRALGFTATTNMGGAGKWLPEYNEFLRGADVVLLPHNDSAGRDHADKVATALNGIARRVRALDIAKTWSECPEKGDISDWIEAGGTADRLKTAIGDLPDWEHAEQPRLRPLTAAEFLARELPPRKNILGAWLPEKGIVMVYSPRGVGKTLFGMTCAYAIAAGAGFLGFDVPEARKVLYLDAEMPAAAMQERLAAIVQGSEKQPPANDYFRILNGDLTEFGLPDLATPEGQALIDAGVGDSDVVVVDNISTMVRTGKENEAESWLPIQNWALRHRRAGRAIVLLHHAGKGGAQRGTSRREDVLDAVICLRHPADYTTDQGCRFEAHFEKARGFYGEAAQSFEAQYEVREGKGVWTRKTIVDAEQARVVAAIKDGMSIREAAEELGFHRSKVERLRKKAIAEGKLSATEGMATGT